MSNERIENLSMAISVFVLGLSLFALVFKYVERKSAEQYQNETFVTDTLIIRDTVTVEKPVAVTRTIRDTVAIPVPITQIEVQTDTVYVLLEEENIEWADSLCRVYAHGINPEIDSVKHYIATSEITTTITRTPKPKRWGIGVQAGYGASDDGLSPYIGIGVTYSLIRF